MLASDLKTELRDRCRAHPRTLALPDSEDPRALTVAHTLLTEGSASAISLYSPKAATLALAATHGIDLTFAGDKLRWPCEAALSSAERLAVASQHLRAGTVDGILAGNIATTAEVIRAAIKLVGLSPGVKTVSGAFLMHKPQAAPAHPLTYLFADCGVVVEPTATQLVDIAVASVHTLQRLQAAVPPVVAFLSFSTRGSASHPRQALMRDAAAAFAQRLPAVSSDGELQFDAAFDAAIGARKAPGSQVPGRANIFIFPNLDAANIAYKITQRLAGFEAYGPLLQGVALPLNDLSRGATVVDMLTSAYITMASAAKA